MINITWLPLVQHHRCRSGGQRVGINDILDVLLIVLTWRGKCVFQEVTFCVERNEWNAIAKPWKGKMEMMVMETNLHNVNNVKTMKNNVHRPQPGGRRARQQPSHCKRGHNKHSFPFNVHFLQFCQSVSVGGHGSAQWYKSASTGRPDSQTAMQCNNNTSYCVSHIL